MKRLCLIALVAIAGMWGCVPSIHGIATKENTVWDDNLLGRWGDPSKVADPNAEVWQFEKGDAEGQYVLIHHDEKGKTGQFSVSLVQLGDLLFLDIYPGKDTGENINELSRFHLVPAHTFMKVDSIGEELKIRFMDPDSVKKMLKEDPGLVKFETMGDDDDSVVLTAGTSELQEFLLKYAGQIFGDNKDGSSFRKI